MPRMGEKFTYELSWQESLGITSVCDPLRMELADRPITQREPLCPKCDQRVSHCWKYGCCLDERD